MLRFLAVLCLIVVAGCTDPMLSAEMAVGTNGVSVNPTLSGDVGGVSVSVQP
jgi:hypothetical protein